MNKREATRLLKLAKFLRKLNPKGFGFGSVLHINDGGLPPSQAMKKDFQCGTTACAIGWTPVVFPRLVTWDFSAVGSAVRFKDKPWCTTYWDEVGMELFGLSASESAYLFTPNVSTTCGDSLPSDATATEVAEHIEEFVKRKYPNLVVR